MKIEFTHNFIKIFKKRFSSKHKLRTRFDERVKKFAENPDDSILLDHALSGKLQGHRAFSITGDIRVIYFIFKNTAYFIDIGTHNQVYGK